MSLIHQVDPRSPKDILASFIRNLASISTFVSPDARASFTSQRAFIKALTNLDFSLLDKEGLVQHQNCS